MPSNNSFFDNWDISTRPKRRRAVGLMVTELLKIRSAEKAYMERIPENMQDGDAYAAADESIDILTDAIETLSDAY